MQGRDSYRLDPATSIQEQKCAVYRTSPVLLTVLFSEEMVEFLFVRTYVTFQNIKKKWDIKIFGLVSHN